MFSPTRTLIAGAALVAAGIPAALAHHGWSWASTDDFVLTGSIVEIYLGNPHAALKVMADGTVWTVELATPARTAAAGFVEGVAAVGDEVTAHGHRALDPEDMRMKAERITVRGVHYDVYPNDLPV